MTVLNGQQAQNVSTPVSGRAALARRGRIQPQAQVNYSGKGIGAPAAAAPTGAPSPTALSTPKDIGDKAKSWVDTVADQTRDRYPGGVTGGTQGAGNPASPATNAMPNITLGNPNWRPLPGWRPPPSPSDVASGAAGGFPGFNFPSLGDQFGALGGINIFELLQRMGILPNMGGWQPGQVSAPGGAPGAGYSAMGLRNQLGTLNAQPMGKGAIAGKAGPDGRQMAGSIQAQTGGAAGNDPMSRLSRFMSETDIGNLRDVIGSFNMRNSNALGGLASQVYDLSNAGQLGAYSRDAARQAAQDAITRERDAGLRDIAGRAGRGGVVGSGSGQGVYSNAMRAGKEAELALADRAYAEELGRMNALGQARGALAGAQTMGNQLDYGAEMDQLTSNKELLGLLLGFLPEMVDAAVPF